MARHRASQDSVDLQVICYLLFLFVMRPEECWHKSTLVVLFCVSLSFAPVGHLWEGSERAWDFSFFFLKLVHSVTVKQSVGHCKQHRTNRAMGFSTTSSLTFNSCFKAEWLRLVPFFCFYQAYAQICRSTIQTWRHNSILWSDGSSFFLL